MNCSRRVCLPLVCWTVLFCSLHPTSSTAAELHIAAGTTDITPDRPVALSGQRHVRISKTPTTHIYASALAVESRQDNKAVDQAIMVSCDVVAIRDGILQMVRDKVAPRLQDFDVHKLFMNATHTHTAPVMIEGKYHLPQDGIMQPAEFSDWMTSRVADLVVQTWQNRKPGKVAWGQSHAVIAHNRRPFFDNGKAVMYGKTNSAEFRGIEAYEDHSVNVLFFWNDEDRLIATIVNVPCPAQEVEGGRSIHADFWDPVRRTLREQHGEELHILAWTGAGGDVTSRPIFEKASDVRMRKLRGDLSRLDEVARRITAAWEDAYAAARNDIRADVVFAHRVREIDLPYRQVTQAELAEAEANAAKYKDDPQQQWNYRWHHSVVDRYKLQESGQQEPYPLELHALRLGDVAIGTNPFELYTDYAIQMKARSPAVQTFIIQLAGPGTYLPTKRAVELGGYGAVIQSSRIGPIGGQILVEETVQTWNELWNQP